MRLRDSQAQDCLNRTRYFIFSLRKLFPGTSRLSFLIGLSGLAFGALFLYISITLIITSSVTVSFSKYGFGFRPTSTNIWAGAFVTPMLPMPHPGAFITARQPFNSNHSCTVSEMFVCNKSAFSRSGDSSPYTAMPSKRTFDAGAAETTFHPALWKRNARLYAALSASASRENSMFTSVGPHAFRSSTFVVPSVYSLYGSMRGASDFSRSSLFNRSCSRLTLAAFRADSVFRFRCFNASVSCSICAAALCISAKAASDTSFSISRILSSIFEIRVVSGLSTCAFLDSKRWDSHDSIPSATASIARVKYVACQKSCRFSSSIRWLSRELLSEFREFNSLDWLEFGAAVGIGVLVVVVCVSDIRERAKQKTRSI